MKKILLSAISSLVLVTTSINADDDYSHFPSLKAPNAQVALCNLIKFNQELNAIANKPKLSPEDMVKVHEITYTLENAVIRLQKELNTIAVDLEKVHKASETLDDKTVKNSGAAYLKATNLLTATANCQ